MPKEPMEDSPEHSRAAQLPPIFAAHNAATPPIAFEQARVADTDPTGVREVDAHMLGLPNNELMPAPEQPDARTSLARRIFTEHSVRFLHDLAAEDLGSYYDTGTSWCGLNSVRALMETRQALPSLERAARAAGEFDGKQRLQEAVLDIWDEVIEDLPPHEYVALLGTAREHASSLPVASAQKFGTLQKMSHKLAELQNLTDKLLGVEAVVMAGRHQKDHIRFDASREGHDADGQESLARQSPVQDIIDAAMATLPTDVARFSKGADGAVNTMNLGTMVDVAMAGGDVSTFVTLSTFDSLLGSRYRLNEQTKRDEEFTRRAREEFAAAAELLRRDDAKSKVIVDAVRQVDDNHVLPMLATTKALLDEPAMAELNRNPKDTVLMAQALDSRLNAEYLELLEDLQDKAGLPTLCKLYEDDARGLRFLLNRTFCVTRQDYDLERSMGARKVVAAAAEHPNADTLFGNETTRGVIKRWFGDAMHYHNNFSEQQLDTTRQLMDFLSDPEVVVAINTAQTNNPHVFKNRFSLAYTLESNAPELVKRRLQTVAQIPKGLVDHSAASALSFDREGDSVHDRAFTVLGDIEDPTFQNNTVQRYCLDHLLTSGNLDVADRVYEVEDISFTEAQLQAVERVYIHADDAKFRKYMELVTELPESQWPPLVRTAVELAGPEVSRTMASYVEGVVTGTLSPEEQKLLGLTALGEAGLTEMRQVIGTFAAAIRNVDVPYAMLKNNISNVLFKEALKSVTHFEYSKWGAHDDAKLEELIAYCAAAEKDGHAKSMPPEYRPSVAVEIAKLRKAEKGQWTEDLLGRYKTLSRNIYDAAASFSEQSRPFSYLLDKLCTDIQEHVDALGRSLERSDLADKARENMAARRRELLHLITPTNLENPWSIPLRSLKGFEANFRTLARTDQFHDSMRTITFAWAMHQQPEWRNELSSTRPDVEPTLENVSNVREFVEHIVNQEVFGEYFIDKKNAFIFRKMTGAKALEAAILRTQQVGVSENDTTSVQFVPTRGIMMELSGHIADACWAPGKDSFTSIAETVPNMTAVIMKQNPGEPTREKFIGAAMLIESTTPTGEPVLIVRGLNPTESFINHVSVQDFYNKFMNYATEIAEARGRRLAIVIDDHCSGSATNRPVLFQYLDDRRASLHQQVVNAADTTFNKYDITHDTYLAA